jgi:hypothetical protein
MNPLTIQALRDRGIEDLLVTSHSNDGTFDSCPRRFEFIHAWRRSPPRESGTYAADVGTALHEAVQEWARTDSADLGAVKLLREWPHVDERYRRLTSKAIGARTLGNGLLLYDRVVNHHWWADWELVSIKGFGHAIEVPWLIIHESLGPIIMPDGKRAYIATQGKIDFILRNRHDRRRLRVLDLKTTEKDVPAHEAAFRFSDQAGLYALILDHVMDSHWHETGLDVTYFVAYFGSLDNEMAISPLDYTLNPMEVQELIDVKLERITRMHTYASHGRWPRRSHGCEFFGTPCGFLNVCQVRDPVFLKDWFGFDLARGEMIEYMRQYDPVWVVLA